MSSLYHCTCLPPNVDIGGCYTLLLKDFVCYIHLFVKVLSVKGSDQVDKLALNFSQLFQKSI